MRTRGQDDADYGEAARLQTTVNVHVSAETTVEIVTLPEQGRVTVSFTGYRRSSDVTLFLRTAEVRELRDLLTDTLTALTDTPAASAGDGDGAVIDRAA